MIYFALIIHWIADFILQPRWMARSKSEDTVALTFHCSIYTACMCLIGIPLFLYEGAYNPLRLLLSFAFIQGILHFAVDAVTSRISKYFYLRSVDKSLCETERESNESAFWVTIGADQLLHAIALISVIELCK